MNIWRAYFHDADHGLCYYWFATAREANHKLGELMAQSEPQGPHGIELINFPVRKADALRWLNDNFQTDNG